MVIKSILGVLGKGSTKKDEAGASSTGLKVEKQESTMIDPDDTEQDDSDEVGEVENEEPFEASEEDSGLVDEESEDSDEVTDNAPPPPADFAGGDDELDEEPAPRPEVRMRPKNVHELLLDAVPQRARYAAGKLRVHLTGKTLFSLRNTNLRFLLDWSSEEMHVSETDSDDADCKIAIFESDLMRIAAGEVNPQILMLSHRVQVTGKSDHAIYIFNLIAPGGGAYN